VPLVFNMHYLGTMDYWDPTVTDGLARDREVTSPRFERVLGTSLVVVPGLSRFLGH
jgi:hypothetical protein